MGVVLVVADLVTAEAAGILAEEEPLVTGEMNTAKTYFTEAELQRIAATTREVECCTIGEVAVMVINSSDEYREATVLGSLLLGSGISLLLSEIFLDASLTYFILITVLFFPFMRLLLNFLPILKISFVGRRRLEEAVRKRAIMAFYEKGLYKTKANTGVLFFISLLEHKVWVLADKGIYEKIEQQTLNTFAQTVSQGIKEGRACDALCQAISETGKILATHFPLTPGDTNELSDQVIME
jgi:putative membrane protein